MQDNYLVAYNAIDMLYRSLEDAESKRDRHVIAMKLELLRIEIEKRQEWLAMDEQYINSKEGASEL